MRIHNEKESSTIVLGQGRFFGQASIISSCQWSCESVIALTHCDLFSLSVRDFNTLLVFYPNFAKQLSAGGGDCDEVIDDEMQTVRIELHNI